MRKSTAVAGSTVFLALAPGVVVGLVPWWLTGWRAAGASSYWLPLRIVGVALIVAGGAVLVHAFARFALQGRGTPAPVAPPEHLVVTGLYCHVRNPMYVAVVAAIVGQALLLWRLGLLGYAAAVWLACAAFVRWYEEPALRRRFGPEYDAYRRAVPAWIPR